MALALYRTYRPGSLGEVIGQDHITGPLSRALLAGRIHHAYLFSGPRGCGKTSTARILARSLNCEQGPTPQPCGHCASCQDLAPNGPGSVDVVEMDAATHRGIDDARELRERAIYAPAASAYRVYIIDEAHQLTNEAANALLKLVEEPPAHLRFIFATTAPDRIIPTIRSRTFHYGFRLVPNRDLVQHLAAICAKEGIPVEPAALSVVARAAAGSVRDSLSILGQLISGVGPSGLTLAEAVSALGLTEAAVLDDFVAALTEGSAAAMFAVVNAVVDAGHDPRRFAGDVLDRLRDLIILRADPNAADVLELPPDDVERLRAQAGSLSAAQLSWAADLVSSGLTEIKGVTAPRLQLELLCARLALAPAGADQAVVLARLDRLERGFAEMRPVSQETAPRPLPDPVIEPDVAPLGERAPSPGGAARPSPPRAPQRPELRSRGGEIRVQGQREAHSPGGQTRARITNGPEEPKGGPGPGGGPSAGGPGQGGGPDSSGGTGPGGGTSAQGTVRVGTATGSLTTVRQSWPAILERLAKSSRVAWTLFHEAAPLSVDDGVLCLAVTQAGYLRAITANGHDERLRQAIIEVVGLDVRVTAVHDPEAAKPAREVGGAQQSGQHQSRLQGALGRSGMEAGPAVVDRSEPDEPSPDDPDLGGGADGIALITRELGARTIGEIDHS